MKKTLIIIGCTLIISVSVTIGATSKPVELWYMERSLNETNDDLYRAKKQVETLQKRSDEKFCELSGVKISHGLTTNNKDKFNKLCNSSESDLKKVI